MSKQLSKDESAVFDLVKSVVERTIQNLNEVEQVGGIGRYRVYDEFLKEFRIKAYK